MIKCQPDCSTKDCQRCAYQCVIAEYGKKMRIRDLISSGSDRWPRSAILQAIRNRNITQAGIEAELVYLYNLYQASQK